MFRFLDCKLVFFFSHRDPGPQCELSCVCHVLCWRLIIVILCITAHTCKRINLSATCTLRAAVRKANFLFVVCLHFMSTYIFPAIALLMSSTLEMIRWSSSVGCAFDKCFQKHPSWQRILRMTYLCFCRLKNTLRVWFITTPWRCWRWKAKNDILQVYCI